MRRNLPDSLRRVGGLLVARKYLHRLPATDRFAEEIPLHLRAVFCAQDFELFLRFNAFCGSRFAKADGKSNDGSCDRSGVLVPAQQFIHEAAVDLDFVERKFLQNAE